MEATILVIEESLDLCRLFEYMLRADGYSVSTFHSWRAAEEALATVDPDLIIFDWPISNIKGYTWAETLRRTPATSHIPLLFVCGDQPPRVMLEQIGGAGISVIEKPFDIFLFRNRVTALLGMRERIAGARYA